MEQPEILSCPVCQGSKPVHFSHIEGRDYWVCNVCEARFLDQRFLPDKDAEYAHYLQHENEPHDAGYRRFLSKLAVPFLTKFDAPAEGLDFGCGPGPALAMMLREAGHSVALYDPFFFPDETPLKRRYDFVTCTETAEHFHSASAEFDRLDTLLHPGGWLGIMTCFQTDDARFSNWHYRQDPTHVVFYRPRTFEVIAEQRNWSCEIPAKDVVIMRKQ